MPVVSSFVSSPHQTVLYMLYMLYMHENVNQVLSEPPMVRPSWCGPKVDAIQYHLRCLADINHKLRPKQESKLEAAKVCLLGRVCRWLVCRVERQGQR